MGHHSTKMTADRYYQLVEDLKRKAVSKLPTLKVIVSNMSNNSAGQIQNIRQNIRQIKTAS